MNMKTVYCLRIRPDDESDWSNPTYYQKRRNRDHDASFNRIIGGIRTHSYEEKLDPQTVEFADQP